MTQTRGELCMGANVVTCTHLLKRVLERLLLFYGFDEVDAFNTDCEQHAVGKNEGQRRWNLLKWATRELRRLDERSEVC